MDPKLLEKYDGMVPRYTSYPTAPHFGEAVGTAEYRDWLAASAPEAPLSLYLHVPYCDSLCWFCGCHTKIVRRYRPVATYVASLKREIALVAKALGGRRPVGHLHFGGGSPTILAPEDVAGLGDALRANFQMLDDAEIAVEIDPREVTRETVGAWAAIGTNRASLGVQDFDLRVQEAINRRQSFEETKQVVDWLRGAGVGGLNIDLMYGLPHQGFSEALRTTDRVIELAPDRIALFGYAHVPWMKRHQRLIPEEALPGRQARFDQSQAMAARLVEAGYLRIGLDHFARPEDPLAVAQAEGRLQRNFQGYTADPCAVLVGLGASAIGALPQGFVQNEASIKGYMAAVDGGRLATVRGLGLDGDDRLRGRVIERLMCDLGVDFAAVRAGDEALSFGPERDVLAEMAADGLVTLDDDRLRVTETGRPLLRNVCAVFDRYLAAGRARHSRAV